MLSFQLPILLHNLNLLFSPSLFGVELFLLNPALCWKNAVATSVLKGLKNDFRNIDCVWVKVNDKYISSIEYLTAI